MKLGLSTGCFWKMCDYVTREQITLIRNTGCNAIELSATSPQRIEALLKMDSSIVSTFSYVSLHGPKLNLPDEEVKLLLGKLQLLVERFSVNTVVLHPDVISNWDLLAESGLPVGLENMDSQKNSFRSAAELVPLFEKYGFKFVYDVNHVLTNDSTLKLAESFKPLWKYIAHIHFSGMKEYDGYLNHYPVFLTEQDQLFGITPRTYPVIIESPF